MSKRTKIIIIIVAVLLVATIAYFIFRKKPEADKPITDTNGTKTTSTGPLSNPLFKPATFPLDINMMGEDVKRLQMALNRINTTYKISEDGVFGDETKIKLLRTVPTTQSRLPMSMATWLEIIKKANAL